MPARLALAALGQFSRALLHIVVLIGGPEWIAFVGAWRPD